MTNKSQLAGIFSIVSGAIGVIVSLGIFLLSALFIFIADNPLSIDSSPPPDWFGMVMGAFYVLWGIAILLLSALAITGGIFALKKKHWGVALAGSIGALVCWPLGITSIIFVSLGKEEFAAKVTPINPPVVQPPAAPPIQPAA